MDTLLDHIITERDGHYCHVLELDSVYSLECAIEQVVSDYKDSFTLGEIIEFFDSIEIYYIADECLTSEVNDAIESELYDFGYIEFIKDCYY